MKFFLIAIILIVAALQSTSQALIINEFNKQRILIEKKNFIVIAAWGAANILYNGISAGAYHGSEKYIRQMNVLWGSVNFSLGAIGYLFAQRQQTQGFTQTVKRQIAIEKVYLFNTGLDAAYVIGGFYLKERSYNRTQNSEKNKGFGESIILQGSTLFLYDGIMYVIHNIHGKKLYKLADKLQIGINENGIGCSLSLQ